MKLLIVRHGDPDYKIDSLTQTGWKEAELLAERLCKLDVKAFYVSPLGRAQDTASVTLNRIGRKAEVCPWLQEFGVRIRKPGENHLSCLWDWLPEIWTSDDRNYDRELWSSSEIFERSGVPQNAKWVTDSFDALLARHGYVREGRFYRAEQPNTDTIVLFCHFGVECVLLGHLLQISPMLLWHGTCAAPTSVTTVVTEERREGIACFRMSAFGDISHLYAADQPPAFAARFCEVYSNFKERHD